MTLKVSASNKDTSTTTISSSPTKFKEATQVFFIYITIDLHRLEVLPINWT